MVFNAALLQASSQKEAEVLREQRKQVRSVVSLSIALMFIPLLCGVSAFQQKWIPIIELRWRSSTEWQALRWPRGDFGFILSEHDQLPQDVSNATIVNCGLTPEEAPCYALMKPLVVHIWVMTMLCPLFPIIFAVLHAWWTTKAVQEVHDRRLHRAGVYVCAVIFLQVWTEAKKAVQARLHSAFDPSDTVCAFLFAAAIGARELSHLHQHAIPSRTLAAAVMMVGMLAQMYYLYFTARYFHLPSEVSAGAASGMLFSGLFVHLTTTSQALKSVFVSVEEGRHFDHALEA